MTKKTFCRIPGPGETRACIDPWIFVYVRSNGDVDACCRGVTIGNLRDKSFEEVVNGADAIELRRQVLTGELPPGCMQCATRPVTSVENLNRMVEHLVYDTSADEKEDLRRQLREHRAVRSDLMREREALQGHAATLEKLLGEARGHAANLESERPHLAAHIANLERERAGLETERAALQTELAARDLEAQRRRGLLEVLGTWFRQR